MYTSKNYQKKTTNTTENKPYNSRIFMMPSYYVDKDGKEVYDNTLIGFDNYWFVNHSKAGGIYGRINITGDYNVKRIKQEYPSVEMYKDGYTVTLFLFDWDAEYLDKTGEERTRKSFVARLYEKDGGLCAQVLKMF